MDKDNLNDNSPDTLFNLLNEDEDILAMKNQQAKDKIESMLDNTLGKTIANSGRSIERANEYSEINKSEKVKLKRNGIITYNNGTEKKEDLLDILSPLIDDDKEFEIEEYKILKIKRQMKLASIGPVSSVAMICLGDKCQVKETCPYWKNDIAPIGEECLPERLLIKEWIERYIEEFNVDINKTTEFQLVSELAEIAVFERRINSYLAIMNPMLLQEEVSGTDQFGNPYTNLNISKAFEIKVKLKQQRMKILDAMLATRDRKAKLIITAANNSGNLNEIADIKKKILDLAKSRIKEKEERDIIDGESKKKF